MRIILSIVILLLVTGYACLAQSQDPAVLETAESLVQKATTLYLMGDIDSAIERVQQALKMNASHEQALRLQRSLVSEKGLIRQQDEMKSEIQLLRSEADVLKSQIASLIATHAVLTREKEDAQSQMKATLAEKDTTVQSLTQERDGLKVAAEGAQEARESEKALRDEVARLNSQLAEATARLEEESSHATVDGEQAQDALTRLKGTLALEEEADLSKTIIAAEEKMSGIEEKLASALSQVAQLEGEIEAGQMVGDDLRKDALNLQQKIQVLEEEKTSLAKKAEEAERQTSESRDKKGQADSEKDALAASLSKAVETLNAEKEALLKSLDAAKAENAALKNQTAGVQVSQNALAKTQQEVESLAGQVNQLRQDLESSVKQRDELRKELDVLTRKLTQYRLQETLKSAPTPTSSGQK